MRAHCAPRCNGRFSPLLHERNGASPMTTQTSFLIGLIGAGIGGSLTPAMHEEEGSKLGLHYVYRRIDLEALKLDVAALPDLLMAAERMGFNGLNITYPCKQAVIPLLDELSDDARALGAVNTVLFKDGKRIGHNTDWSGFARAFQRGLPDVSLERVVQLGAGGAGAAVAHAALTLGRKIAHAIRCRRHARRVARRRIAEALSRPPSSAPAVRSPKSLAAANGLIHATPTGMAKLPGLPLPVELLHRDLWVADIVYFPIRTALLQAAEGARLPHAERRRHGGVSGGRRHAHLHRSRTGRERMFTHFQSLAATLTVARQPVTTRSRRRTPHAATDSIQSRRRARRKLPRRRPPRRAPSAARSPLSAFWRCSRSGR